MRTRRIWLASAIVMAILGVTAIVFVRSPVRRARPVPALLTASPKTTPQRVAQEAPPVQIVVTKLNLGSGKIKYRYTVTNGSAFPITAVIVGFDNYYTTPQLSGEPSGWDGDTIPSSSFEAPPGWKFQVLPFEEDSLLEVRWEIAGQGGVIMGGESMGGFGVVLDGPDPAYENSNWVTYMRGHDEYSALLSPSGVTSVPVSSVHAHSDLVVGPNPAAARVDIQFSVGALGLTTVEVFDVSGRRVKTVLKARTAVGTATTSWNGQNEMGREVASGVYFIRVKTPTTERFARVTWMRNRE